MTNTKVIVLDEVDSFSFEIINDLKIPFKFLKF